MSFSFNDPNIETILNKEKKEIIVSGFTNIVDLSFNYEISENALSKIHNKNGEILTNFSFAEPMFITIVSEDKKNTNTWSINIEAITEIENTIFKKINIYPNPASNYIFINNLTNKTSIKIYSILGKLVKQINTIENNKIKVDIGDLQTGIYFLKLLTGNKIKTIKIAIQK